MTKLPAKKDPYPALTRAGLKPLDIQRIKEPRYSYLPVTHMKWIRINKNLYSAEPAAGHMYVVERLTGKYDCYWMAKVSPDKVNKEGREYITLGVTFLSRFEGMEVCEAWEHERGKTLGATNEPTKQLPKP